MTSGILLSVHTLWLSISNQFHGPCITSMHAEEYPLDLMEIRSHGIYPFYVERFKNKQLQKAGRKIPGTSLYESYLSRVMLYNPAIYFMLTGDRLEEHQEFVYPENGVIHPRYTPPIKVDFVNLNDITSMVDTIIKECLLHLQEAKLTLRERMNRIEEKKQRIREISEPVTDFLPIIIPIVIVDELDTISKQIDEYVIEREKNEVRELKTADSYTRGFRFGWKSESDSCVIFAFNPFGWKGHDYLGWSAGSAIVGGGMLNTFYFVFVESKRAVREVQKYDSEKGYPVLHGKGLRKREISAALDFVDLFIGMTENCLVKDSIIEALEKSVNVIDSLPKGVVLRRPLRLIRLVELHEDTIVHRRAHFLVNEWLKGRKEANQRIMSLADATHIKEIVNVEGFPNFFAGLDHQNLVSENRNLENQLEIAERTIQLRVDLERTAVQHKRELFYNRISIVLGTLVIFEIIGSFLSWFYTPIDFTGIALWAIVIVIMICVLLWVFLAKGPQSL
ncbi:MAG: hypothetical protein KAU48_09700 [Candidatus Thorarchaeota archaeon]|nr:hypothetical protein [Candidatus Thorarchaeota archaeon]